MWLCTKIDYICIGYSPIVGGTESIVSNIAERMVQRGHDVTVHTSTYNPNYIGDLPRFQIINGVKVRRYRLLPLFIFLPKIRDADIIHLFSYGDNFLIQSLVRSSKLLVTSPIGEEIYAKSKFRNKLLGRFILNRAKKVFAMTNFEKTQLNTLYKVKLEKMVLLPGGVGEESFLPIKIENIREEILKICNLKYFVRLARVDRIKRLEFGIKLLEYFPDLTYVVVGTLDNDAYFNELKDLSERLMLKQRVVFTGKLNEDEKRMLLHNSQFYLISNHETFGIATVEAMAQDVPIVAPFISEYNDILINQENSLLYDYDSIESCRRVVDMLLKNDALKEYLGCKGKHVAREKFYWDRIADVAEKIYKEISGNGYQNQLGQEIP